MTSLIPTNMERVHHPEISFQEVWDMWVEGATWWEWSHEPEYPGILCEALKLLWTGEGTTQSRRDICASIRHFEAVFLSGGGALNDEMLDELSGLPFAVTFCDRPVFGAESGGIHLLESRKLSGWVADLGQSQLKLVAPTRRWTFPRDWTRLPAAGRVLDMEIPTQRRRLREFIGIKLRLAVAETEQPPQSLVFALPGALTDDGTPTGSNYAGMKGDRALLPDALSLAGLDHIPLFVLNDAELAAHSARLDPRLSDFRKILVLTLGTGIGAALIQRAN